MKHEEALAFVEKHGVVLLAARGPVPRLTEAIVGEPISGSWWGHPRSHEIFEVLQVVGASEDVLMCRLVGEKVTLVHRRLWPALVRASKHFSAKALAKVSQEHTASGAHESHEVAFPDWVPPEVNEQASRLDEDAALVALGAWASTRASSRKSSPAKGRTRRKA